MVALRAHAWEELDWLVQLSKDLGLLKQHYRVVPKKQRDFGELVQGVMQGITPVIPQFRVGRRFIDFYLPDYCIAVEYDEDYHKSRRRSLADKHREREIRSHIPNVVFLRVMEGEEVPALNRLFLLLIGNLQPKSHR